jgi:hypothetical protein
MPEDDLLEIVSYLAKWGMRIVYNRQTEIYQRYYQGLSDDNLVQPDLLLYAGLFRDKRLSSRQFHFELISNLQLSHFVSSI